MKVSLIWGYNFGAGEICSAEKVKGGLGQPDRRVAPRPYKHRNPENVT